MIKKIVLENFKAFKNAEIEIKPLTILVGPNSGGKTSLLHSIALIQQTLKTSYPDVLKFKGTMNFGDFESILHQNATSKEIRIRFEFEEENKYFDVTIYKDGNAVEVKNFSCNTGEFEYTLQNIKKVKSTESKLYQPDSYSFKFKGIEKCDEYLIKNVKPVFYRKNFLIAPSFPRDNFDLFSKYINGIGEELSKIRNSKIDILSLEDRMGFENRIRSIQMFISVEKFFNDYNLDIRQKFGNISYLGPLRNTAFRLYERGHFENVGFNGENAVPIIAENQSIKQQVAKILEELDIAKFVEILEKDDRYFELKLKMNVTDSPVNFADVGCGTSQVLPIIVQSLLSKKNGMILIEQPEIHLHPKVQADFASFIVNLVKKSKTKFMIETHSEYFVERVRTKIMEDPNLSKYVSIYYVEQSKLRKESVITPIEITQEGQYDYLPEGYLTNMRVKEIDDQMAITFNKLEKMTEQENDNF